MNTTAVVHITHDLILFMTELNSQFEWIETVIDQEIQTRDVETINLDVILDNDENTKKQFINIHLHDVHYCFEVNSNLLSLDVLEEKDLIFNARNDVLRVLDSDENVVLVVNRQRNVYVLHQLIEINQYAISSIFSIKSKSASMKVWHQRVEYVNVSDLSQLSLIVIDVKFSDIKSSFCETCVLEKQHRVHNFSSITHRSKIFEERLHSDLFEGDNTLSAVREHKYEVVVIDDATRIKFSLTLKNKDDICSVVISVFNKMKNQIDRKIKFFRTDDEEKFKDLTSELNGRSIQWKKSASYAQDQNDVSKRSIRTILERARTLMIHAHLSRKFWFEALIAACYIINRLLIKSLKRMTSYETWYEEKSDLSNLRVYDCDVYVIDYQAKFNDKMISRSWVETLIDYESKNQWRIYNETRVMIRRDVVFNKAKLIFKKSTDSVEAESVKNDSMKNVDLTDLLQSVRVRNTDLQQSNVESNQSIIVSNQVIESMSSISADENDDVALVSVDQDDDENVASMSENDQASAEIFFAENSITELVIEIILSNQKDEFFNSLIMIEFRKKIRHDYKKLHTSKSNREREREFVKIAIISASHQIATLVTYEEAISCSQIVQWKQIMQAEYDNQMKRETFQIVNLSYDQKAIDDKWIYKLKENLDESIARYKVRWVIKSYRQIEDRDFDETYALVIRVDTSRMMLTIAAVLNYQIKQFDIKTTFLYDQMNRMIYIDQSKDFEIEDPNKTCLLNTDLYELMQSLHLWFDEIKRKLLTYELTQSKHDEALFFKEGLYVTLYVNDIKTFVFDAKSIDHLSQHLKSKYEMTDQDVQWYLKMKITRNSRDESILLTQTKYIRDLLTNHEMKECSFVSISMIEVKLKKSLFIYVCGQKELKNFQTLLEELMHLMMQTRSDIAYAVSRLTQFMINSSIDHWIALKRILRYLQSTKELEICYNSKKQQFSDNRLNIETWSDVSWDEDLDDVRSINDHVTFMIEESIAWKSFKQISVALSSTEIEYVSQTLTCTQIMWIRDVLTEIDIRQVIFSEFIIIFADNQKIIKLTENFVFQKRTKHIAIKYHYTRDLIKQKDVQLIYKAIDQMIVDELTKSLESILFKKFVASLDMTSVIEASILEKSTLSQSIRDGEHVEHSHRHERFIVEHTADHSGHGEHIVGSDHKRHDDNIAEHGEHSAEHSDHEKHSAIEKHLRRHVERRIEAHREHLVISERRIETRWRRSIIEEHRTDEHSDDHQ